MNNTTSCKVTLPASSWTNWSIISRFVNDYDIEFQWRTNRKVVQVRNMDKTCKCKPTCHSEDAFVLDDGIYLAALRLDAKNKKVLLRSTIDRYETDVLKCINAFVSAETSVDLYLSTL